MTEMCHCVFLLKSLCDPELLTSGSMFSFIQYNSEICGFYNVSYLIIPSVVHMRISVFLLCFKVDLLNSDDHSSIYTYMYKSIRLPVKS